MIFANCQVSFGTMGKQTYKHYKTFNVKHQKKVWKGLYHQISLMSHTMHISDKWNILSWDLNCNSRSQALDGMDPSIPKQMNLETSSSFVKPPCVIKKFMINKVRLSTSNLESTSFIFNNKVCNINVAQCKHTHLLNLHYWWRWPHHIRNKNLTFWQ